MCSPCTCSNAWVNYYGSEKNTQKLLQNVGVLSGGVYSGDFVDH